MKRKIVICMTLLALGLSACGKQDTTDEIKKVEASNAAESREPTEKKYEDTKKEPVVAPDRNGNNSEQESSAEVEEEQVDTSGIMGYWFDDAGNSLQFYHDTDENGNELSEISYSGFLVDSDTYLSGTAETDNQTYIRCKQTEFKSEVSDETPVTEESTESDIITEEFVDPDTGEVTILERSATDKDWVFDESGKIIAWIDSEGNQQPILDEDKEAVDAFNNMVGIDEIPEDEAVGEDIKDVEYTITRFEVDKENGCTYMDITFDNKQLSLTRYN